jgi:hypothetical protein
MTTPRTAVWLLVLAACSPPYLDEPLAHLPLLDPEAGFDAWDAMPPPPLSACAGFVALRAGLQYTSFRDAMGDAVSGDTVWVCPGVHNEVSAPLPPGDFAVAGVDPTPGAVVIDLPGTVGSAIKIWNTDTSVHVRDITFAGSDGTGEPITIREGERLDLRRLRFLDALGGKAISATNVPFVRARDLEVTGGTGEIFTVNCQGPASTTQPPCDAHISSLRVADRGFGAINMDAEGPLPARGATPFLTARFDDVTIENVTTHTGLIDVDGHNFDVTFDRLRIRNVSTFDPWLPASCPYGRLISMENGSQMNGGVLRIEDFEITDTQSYATVAFGHMGSPAPLTPWDRRLQLVNGIFHRNESCHATVFPSLQGRCVRFENVDFGSGADDNYPMDWPGRMGSMIGTPCYETQLGAGTRFGFYYDVGATPQCYY